MTIPSLSRLSQEIAEIYQLENNERLEPVLKHELKQYKRKKSNAGFEDREVLLDTDEFKAKGVAKRKPFVELGNKQRNTNDILQTITSFVEELNQDVENPMTITQFLGYLIHGINYAENKKTAEIGLSLFHQHKNAMSFDETKAISLMHELTQSKYQMIKVNFPKQKLLLSARQELRPPYQK